MRLQGHWKLLKKIIKEVPPPNSNHSYASEGRSGQFRALIFDSEYDSFKGVVAFVRVVDGEISNGEKIELMATKTSAEVKELGYLNPGFSPQQKKKNRRHRIYCNRN